MCQLRCSPRAKALCYTFVVSSEYSERGNTQPTYASVLHLARGGMGEVTLALRKEGEFQRLYALKRLIAPYHEDDEVRTMFLDEARIAGLIHHPNVVSVLDVGTDDNGPFLVMDYVEGVSFSQLVKQVAKDGAKLPLQVILRVVADACRGLHAAHELVAMDGTPQPVVHRDVSPQNVLLGFDGVARVTDFGVAKVLDHFAQTSSGLLKGKAGYMSPEQLRFEVLDRRSDLFSVGVVLFEMLAGRRLYVSKNKVPPARRILDEPPPDIGEDRSDLPPPLIALSFRLLAKDKELRPTNALEVAEQLEAIRVPLEGEQGAVDVGKYVSELFAEQQRERVQTIASALEQVEAIGRVVGGTSIDLHIEKLRGTATVRERPVPVNTLGRTRDPSEGRQRHRLLVAVAVTMAVFLLVGIGLLLGSSLRAQRGEGANRDSPEGSSGGGEASGTALITGKRVDVVDQRPASDAGSIATSLSSLSDADVVDGNAGDTSTVEDRGERQRGRRHTWGPSQRPSREGPAKSSNGSSSDSRYKLRTWE